MRRRLAFWICPDLRAEVTALQDGNVKCVLENQKLRAELEYRKAGIDFRAEQVATYPAAGRYFGSGA